MYSKSLEIINRNGCIIHVVYWEARGDLMVSALVYGSSGPGSSPGRGHCVVFLGKTLNPARSARICFVVFSNEHVF